MGLSRREFLRYCGIGTLGASLSQLYVPRIIEALEAAAAGEPPVIWLQGSGCTGCSVSLLNTVHPSIQEVLLKILSVKFHPTVMAAAGDMAVSAIEEAIDKNAGKYILIVEGAVPTAAGGMYCTLGEKAERPVTLKDWVAKTASRASVTAAVGTCASYGGIPSGQPNPTGAKGVGQITDAKVLNVPGCPPHPDWIVGSLAHVLMFGLPELDEYGRPVLFYGKNIHETCPNFSYYNSDQFAEKFGDEGCLVELGCKGPMTFSDCPDRHWNNGVNWCIGSQAPCIGCVESGFPDEMAPLYGMLQEDLLPAKVKVG